MTEGSGAPKALAAVGGRPLIVGLVETLTALGCETITCVVRADFPEVAAALGRPGGGAGVRVLARRTPSSLHSFAEGLAAMPPGRVFCSMVDTVMRPIDWAAVWKAAGQQLDEGAEVMLAVTPYVDDEAALYVRVGEDGTVSAIGEAPVEPMLVTGGVYAFDEAGRARALEAVAEGLRRMRGLLKVMVAEGRRVTTVVVPRIMDVDRPVDLDAANAWITSGDQ